MTNNRSYINKLKVEISNLKKLNHPNRKFNKKDI